MALKTGNPSRSTVDPKLYSIYESPEKQGVDFFKEGQKIAKPIKDTEERFIKEKAEDQKAFDERNKSISEIDLSQDQTFNAISLRYSQDMANNNMSDFDKVKRGEMSRTDFKIRQNNRSQSIATWGSTVKDYNKSFEAAQKRMQDGKSGLQEQANMKGMAGFGNMANVVLIDDPNSAFGLMIELTDEEQASGTYPSYKEDPSRYVSATQANARMNQKIDKVNVVEKSKQYSETLGTTIKAYLGEDSMRTKEDFLLRDGGNKLISNYAKAVIGEGNETASVLADNIGGYTFTTVKSEAGGKVIYQEIQENGNHIAILDEEQIQAAQEYTEGVLKAQLDIKETAKQTRGKTATELKGEKDDETAKSYLNSIDMLITGTAGDADAGGKDLVNLINREKAKDTPRLKSVQRVEDADGNISFEVRVEGKQLDIISTVDGEGKKKDPEQIRREIFGLVTPKGTGNYDSAKETDLEGEYGAGSGGGIDTEDIIIYDRTVEVDGETLGLQDWKSTLDLGSSLQGDGPVKVIDATARLFGTAGFLPPQFKDAGDNYAKVNEAGQMVIYINGKPTEPIENWSNLSSELYISRIQDIIQKKVDKTNQGSSTNSNSGGNVR